MSSHDESSASRSDKDSVLGATGLVWQACCGCVGKSVVVASVGAAPALWLATERHMAARVAAVVEVSGWHEKMGGCAHDE